MRQDYIDVLGDYVPRGQQHFKMRVGAGCVRLSVRSMEQLQREAAAGNERAAATLAGGAFRQGMHGD
jgi:hypothetical protein